MKRATPLISEAKLDGSFSSCRRRLRVISANGTILNAVLNDVNEIHHFDVKELQLLLHGAVMPTVNPGLLSYAEAFTQLEQWKRYGDDCMLNLELGFRSRFLKEYSLCVTRNHNCAIMTTNATNCMASPVSPAVALNVE
ncbi:hypothetical protein KIN20_019530 [Parelaphostrongylus tenuis]|uniref:DOCKER Lobe C domain-containing protein n=1 Tax=Parelaphostrongylus tenuis TaxID=148309 RepID=A0AAD5QV48_PARTN|nr:hypothetical protein KIN20_019530 [Parelaphostrongylus tenuis]